MAVNLADYVNSTRAAARQWAAEQSDSINAQRAAEAARIAGTQFAPLVNQGGVNPFLNQAKANLAQQPHPGIITNPASEFSTMPVTAIRDQFLAATNRVLSDQNQSPERLFQDMATWSRDPLVQQSMPWIKDWWATMPNAQQYPDTAQRQQAMFEWSRRGADQLRQYVAQNPNWQDQVNQTFTNFVSQAQQQPPQPQGFLASTRSDDKRFGHFMDRINEGLTLSKQRGGPNAPPPSYRMADGRAQQFFVGTPWGQGITPMRAKPTTFGNGEMDQWRSDYQTWLGNAANQYRTWQQNTPDWQNQVQSWWQQQYGRDQNKRGGRHGQVPQQPVQTPVQPQVQAPAPVQTQQQTQAFDPNTSQAIVTQAPPQAPPATPVQQTWEASKLPNYAARQRWGLR